MDTNTLILKYLIAWAIASYIVMFMIFMLKGYKRYDTTKKYLLILIYLFAPITILLFFYGLLEDSYCRLMKLVKFKFYNKKLTFYIPVGKDIKDREEIKHIIDNDGLMPVTILTITKRDIGMIATVRAIKDKKILINVRFDMLYNNKGRAIKAIDRIVKTELENKL